VRISDLSTTTPHRIGRLRFEIDGIDEASLLSARTGIVDGAEGWIPDALDTALGSLDDLERTISFDRLEVDLGVLPANGLTPALLSAAIRQTLTRELGRSGSQRPPEQYSNSSHGLIQTVRFFLERGRLPWWSPVESLAVMEKEISMLDGAAIRRLARDTAPTLRLARAARRLVIEVDSSVAVLIVGSLPGSSPGEFDVAAWTTAREGGDIEALAERVRDIAGAKPGRSEGIASESPRDDSVGDAAATDDHLPDTDDSEADAADDEESEVAFEDVIAVGDAGLVIVHPFLGTLFDERRFTDKTRFVGEAEQQLAVRLTAYLARGDSAVPEPDLTLSKLLCGWPLDEPVARRPALKAEDRAEADALLRAVVEHWTAFGQSSPEALRETFLNRPGRFVEGRDGWRLEVQRRGPDVLLDRLPWSVSTIRLPWMDRALSVDWV